DRKDPGSPTWSDVELPRWLLRSRLARHNGAPLAGNINRTNFDGHGRTALAWLADDGDVLAPRRLYAHLERAYLEADPAARQHHLAMALVCLGALLHVAQDLSVPAHARGDVSAMFLPLSDVPGDRGLPLQELARDAYGRAGLPTPLALTPRPAEEVARGTPRAPTLQGHVLGHDTWPGLVQQAGGRYFSESSLPGPRALEPTLSPQQAAAALLEGAVLDPSEREGAQLSPWPASRGYLLGGSGAPLAAFRVDAEQQVHLWLDRRVHRLQMQQLIPLGVDAGRSILDLVHAGWPAMDVDRQARTVSLTPGATWSAATLLVMLEDAAGRREAIAEMAMQGPARHRVVEAWPAALPEGSRVVLVLRNPAGTLPAATEHALDLRPPAEESEATPVPRATMPKARSGGPATRPSGARPPLRKASDGATPDSE
ncbi:MAG: hypothetical protein KDK70_42510, partial [Myxococcales bacterium]|nr:hypothetical protein [Myxococcales bacterium]